MFLQQQQQQQKAHFIENKFNLTGKKKNRSNFISMNKLKFKFQAGQTSFNRVKIKQTNKQTVTFILNRI